MAQFSRQTKLGDLLGNKDYMAVVDKYVAGASRNPGVAMVRGLTLEQIAAIPQVHATPEQLDALIAELNSTFA